MNDNICPQCGKKMVYQCNGQKRLSGNAYIIQRRWCGCGYRGAWAWEPDVISRHDPQRLWDWINRDEDTP